MALVLDTGALYAYYDSDDAWHVRIRELIDSEPGVLMLPASIIAELDYLIGRELGTTARKALYQDIVEGVYLVDDLPRAGYRRVLELNDQFDDLELGFVDAAVMATAEASGVMRIATTDRRDFGPVSASLGFELCP